MDFDRITDRRGTGSLKWDAVKPCGKYADVIPLWVADMDFPPPREVTEELRKRTEHPIFGYTTVPGEYFELLSAWYEERYGATVGKEAFLVGPGVVPSLGIAVRTFTEPGDGVLIMPPVYYPFTEMIRTNGRVPVEAPLERTAEGGMGFAAEALGRAVSEALEKGVRTKLIMLCSPHNPGGIVWSRGELERMLDFARSNDLLVVSDEIHGDIVFPPAEFVPFAGLEGAGDRTIIIAAPNKTFNIAGLHISHFVVPDEKLRARVRFGLTAAGFSQPNVLSLSAATAAYRSGGAWLDGLLEYLKENIAYAVGVLNGVPGLRAAAPAGTYLIWADASGLVGRKGVPDDRELVRLLETEGGVKLTPGSVFGTGGTNFVRINVACPRPILKEGLARIAEWAGR